MIRSDDDRDVMTAGEYQRYARQMILPEVGIEGQRRLKCKRVLVVGAGGLGSPVTMYLAAAGVGSIDVIDFDSVAVSNLHRQILFSQDDVGQSKAQVARERLRAVNPNVQVNALESRLEAGNAAAVLAPCDLVVDCTDNFATRYLVNDACLLYGKAYVYASIYQFEGHLSVFAAAGGPCYRCVYRESPPRDLVPSCAEGGVLGVLPGVMGTMQGVEAIKLLLGIGRPLVGRLLQYDALAASVREFDIARDPDCPACAPGRRPSLSDAAVCAAPAPLGISVAELARIRKLGEPLYLVDVRSSVEHELASIGNDFLIPLVDLQRRIGEIPGDVPVVLYCLSGARSAKAVELLAGAGITSVRSLTGGMLAWKAMHAEADT